MKNKLFVQILLAVLLICNAYAEVIFQDNFDDHSDWSPTQPTYPNTAANFSSDGGLFGETACTGCPDGTAKYRGYYIASSSWNGYKGNNTLNISSQNARGGTGKAVTFWMEPIDTAKCDGGTRWCSDGQLAVSFPSTYNEIYLRYYIKFDPDWQWDSANAAASEKFLHITHLHNLGGVSMWKFFTSGNHFPVFFATLSDYTFYGYSDGIKFKNHIRFQSSYNPYSATPKPLYLTNNDFEAKYAYDAGGEKTFKEYVGDGNWHSLEWRLKGNSSKGVEDGEWQLWVDGVSIINRTNIAWADSVYDTTCANCVDPPSDFVGWNWASIGGNMYNRVYTEAQFEEQWYAIDDLVISTTYIGPLPPKTVLKKE